MWCVADLDADYIAKMEDVLALYERPYHMKEPVVCLDEKPVSLHAEVRPPRPARPGHLAKRDNEYRRCGTANLFGVVEPKAGRHFTCATPDRSAAQFARVVQRVVAAYPAARTIHVVMDNLNTHLRTRRRRRRRRARCGCRRRLPRACRIAGAPGRADVVRGRTRRPSRGGAARARRPA